MRPTTPLTAAALLGLAFPLLAITSPAADAAAPTCRGQSATIIGSGGSITGTEGPDVVVTNGASSVSTLGGNDLVCITGGVRNEVRILAGDGDDVVDGTFAPDQGVLVTLGSGTDAFYGGSDDDYVYLTYPDPGTGPDGIQGGGGSDSLYVETGPGAAVLDNARGRLSSAGELRATWSGLEEFWLQPELTDRDLTVVGSDIDEQFFDESAGPTKVDVDLGGGDDTWASRQAPQDTSRLDGGAGRDLVYLASGLSDLDLDLRDGLLTVGTANAYEVAADNFEDADLFARRVRLNGTNGPNDLGFRACNGNVRGRSGDDRVKRQYEGIFDVFDTNCRERLTINGGSGDDKLSGTGGNDKILGGNGRDRLNGRRGSDRLIGGPGHDHLRGQNQGDTLLGGRGNDFADGGKGSRDVCRAEHERRCEQ